MISKYILYMLNFNYSFSYLCGSNYWHFLIWLCLFWRMFFLVFLWFTLIELFWMAQYIVIVFICVLCFLSNVFLEFMSFLQSLVHLVGLLLDLYDNLFLFFIGFTFLQFSIEITFGIFLLQLENLDVPFCELFGGVCHGKIWFIFLLFTITDTKIQL